LELAHQIPIESATIMQTTFNNFYFAGLLALKGQLKLFFYYLWAIVLK
jgi:hypothetical protein